VPEGPPGESCCESLLAICGTVRGTHCALVVARDEGRGGGEEREKLWNNGLFHRLPRRSSLGGNAAMHGSQMGGYHLSPLPFRVTRCARTRAMFRALEGVCRDFRCLLIPLPSSPTHVSAPPRHCAHSLPSCAALCAGQGRGSPHGGGGLPPAAPLRTDRQRHLRAPRGHIAARPAAPPAHRRPCFLHGTPPGPAGGHDKGEERGGRCAGIVRRLVLRKGQSHLIAQLRPICGWSELYCPEGRLLAWHPCIPGAQGYTLHTPTWLRNVPGRGWQQGTLCRACTGPQDSGTALPHRECVSACLGFWVVLLPVCGLITSLHLHAWSPALPSSSSIRTPLSPPQEPLSPSRSAPPHAWFSFCLMMRARCLSVTCLHSASLFVLLAPLPSTRPAPGRWRAQEAEREREARLEEERRAREVEEMKNCTFTPEISHRTPKQSTGPILVRGLGRPASSATSAFPLPTSSCSPPLLGSYERVSRRADMKGGGWEWRSPPRI